jgi:hypothetical protein
VLAVAAALGGLLWWRAAAGALPCPDPRLTYAGPYRNVHPAVGYVPDGRCADCHDGIARSFAEHPMGRSLRPAGREGPRPPAGPRQNNPFRAFGREFQVERDAAGERHRQTRLGPDGEPAAELTLEVRYVVGSGTRGESYLVERDGFLYQTPVSKFSRAGIWDLSPGFQQPQLTGRPVQPECLFCHANRVNPREGTLNGYAPEPFEGHAIGCQRCHGPGELHAAGPGAAAKEAGDPTIVNPRRLPPALRDAVCEQCHLEAKARVVRRGRGVFDFRPGLPLEAFWGVYVEAGETEEKRAVSHAEQMVESGCFRGTAGAGRLGCSSCHDPHQAVAAADRVAYYRGRCLACHQKRGCSMPEGARRATSPQDSCIDCHMPRFASTDVVHVASTDHRVPRDPGRPADRRPGPRAAFPLRPFYAAQPGPGDPDGARDLGLALLRTAAPGQADAEELARTALPLLEAAVGRGAGDLAARVGQGRALLLLGRPADALPAFEAALALRSDSESALAGAAEAARQLGRDDQALGLWRRAVAANPGAPAYRGQLAGAVAKAGAWAEARAECREWVRLDPFSVEARTLLVKCLLAADDRPGARAEFARLEALRPDNLEDLREWFAARDKGGR